MLLVTVIRRVYLYWVTSSNGVMSKDVFWN